MIKNIYVTVYKADNAFYQAGKSLQISCNHVNEGNWGLNTYGEIVPLPGATVPNTETALIPEGTVFASPTAFGDSNFKKVTQLKDMTTLSTFWVDTADYNTKVIFCNSAEHS